VGTGLPEAAGQTITNLPGFETSTGSPYGFYFTTLNGGSSFDTLYVADSGVGVTKYSLVGGSWTSNGTVGTSTDSYVGLTGVTTGTTVTLYGTKAGGFTSTGGGILVSIVDSAGYDEPFSATPTVLATALNQTAYRGVAFFP
jgi:hypothetical protein